ncbi:MAG: acyl-CoA dehydrogenase family protein [Streptomycetales bacterium]
MRPVRPVERALPTEDARALLELTREVAADKLAPRAAEAEAAGRFPRDLFRLLGRSGLLGLPYPRQYGGGGQPYEVYLQVVEELAQAWLTVGLGVSVHTLSCFPLARFGSPDQRDRWLPGMIGGDQLGAYCLSEPGSGSDAAALATRAVPEGGSPGASPGGDQGGDYVVTGTKAWISHAGEADFYTVMVRTSDEGRHGISTLLVPAGTPGLSAARPERKMGMSASSTSQVVLDGARVPGERRIGAEGQGFTIALAALDAGRLGIAACSVGLAQAAFDTALSHAKQRRQFGKPIIEFEGLGFMLADMATQIEMARAGYLAAARRCDAGRPFSRQAAMAKLFCSDVAMRVTTDAVQVLGGYGYVSDYPVERYMREAKALQIVEGTNEIQRLVISRALAKS